MRFRHPVESVKRCSWVKRLIERERARGHKPPTIAGWKSVGRLRYPLYLVSRHVTLHIKSTHSWTVRTPQLPITTSPEPDAASAALGCVAVSIPIPEAMDKMCVARGKCVLGRKKERKKERKKGGSHIYIYV